MTARTAGWIGFGAYLIIMFALLMVVAKAYGIWWEIALLPVETLGGMVIGFFIAKAHAYWDQSPPPYAVQAAKNLYNRGNS